MEAISRQRQTMSANHCRMILSNWTGSKGVRGFIGYGKISTLIQYEMLTYQNCYIYKHNCNVKCHAHE